MSTQISPPERILVIHLADIGDLIIMTPALAALRQTFPTARIDILTTVISAPILEGTGLVDHVVLFDKSVFDSIRMLLKLANLGKFLKMTFQLRAAHYDTVIILRHLTTTLGALKYASLVFASGAKQRIGLDNGKGWFLTKRSPDGGFGAKSEAQYWLDVAALIGAMTKHHPTVGISEADQRWAADRFAVLDSSREIIAIHPGSGGYSLARRWEPEKFAALADQLHESRQAQIVLVGGPADGVEQVIANMKHTPLNLVGQTTLNQLAAVLSRCQIYIGTDAGVMHLAAAAAPTIKIYALFGPSNYLAWEPWSGEPPHIIRSEVRCSPCSYIGHTVGLRNGCEARTCMRLLQPEHVIAAINRPAIPINRQPQRNTAKLSIMGVPVNSLTFEDLLNHIADWVKTGKPHQICTANPEFVMVAQKDVNFFNILQRSDLCVPDGIGLLWAARLLGQPLPERVTGSDGVPLIAERAAKEGWRLYLLGAAPGVAEKTAGILCQRYPGLQIAGTYSGSPIAGEEDEIVARVNASHADILFVAYGAPNQDKWIARNLPRLNVSVAMGVGGTFDFIAGVMKRAPLWMRRSGIEWLYRLIQEPRRWRRMLRLPRFVMAFLRQRERGPRMFMGGQP